MLICLLAGDWRGLRLGILDPEGSIPSAGYIIKLSTGAYLTVFIVLI